MSRSPFAVLCCLFLATVVAPSVLAADEAPPDTFVYATYSKCDLARSERADELVEGVYAPIYDEAVSAKKIQAWGWLAHSTGGQWRRLSYLVAHGIDSTLAAGRAMAEKIRKEHPLAAREYHDICYEHDDYIWRVVDGSKPAAEAATKRAKAGFSVYFVCDSSKEARADEIVKDVMAPMWNAQVESGKINSWAWLEHYVGGEYRRLAAFDGPSFESLFAARDATIQQMMEKNAAAMEEFDTICGSHQDYLWDIEIARP